MDIPLPGAIYLRLNNESRIAFSIGYENDASATVTRFNPDGSIAVDGVFPSAKDFVHVLLYNDVSSQANTVGALKTYESNNSDGSHVLLNFAPADAGMNFAFGPGDSLRHGALQSSLVTYPNGTEIEQTFENGHLTHYVLRSTDPTNHFKLEATLNPDASGGSSDPHITITLQNSMHDAAHPVLMQGDFGNFDRLLLISNDGASIISNDGASLILNDTHLITNDGGSLISNDGGSLITNDGGSLTGQYLSDLIGKLGASIISNDGASLISSGAKGVLTSGFSFAGGHLVNTVTAADYSNASADLLANLTAQLGQNMHFYTGVADDPGSFAARSGAATNLTAAAVQQATIVNAGETEWYKTDLAAGTTYVFDLKGLTGGFGTLADPFLRLLDSNGTIISSADDGGLGANSRLVYTPSTSGTFYLVARGFDDAWAGSFALSMGTGTNKPNIESDGGGAAATLDFAESISSSDSGIVTQVQGWDLVSGNTLTYATVGGTDAGKFDLNAGNGFLSFKILPDFESPRDVNKDNTFVVQVRATDGDGFSDTQTLTIRVTDVVEPIYGSHGDDTIDATHPAVTGGVATDNAEWIFGLSGNDVIDGRGGNDSIQGGPGNDAIEGGAGNADTAVFVGVSTDYLITRDLLFGMITVAGRDGSDILSGIERLAFDDRTIVAQIQGTLGNDALTGTSGDDDLAPLTGGHDEAAGLDGNDRLTLDFSALNLEVNFATNTVHSPGGDSVFTYVVAGGFGDLGSDEVLYSSIEAFSIRGSLTQADHLRGAEGADVLIGGAKSDSFDTGLGDDIVDVGKGGTTAAATGEDTVLMGAGGDDLLIADYSAATEAVTFAYLSSQGGVDTHHADYYNSSLNGAIMGGVGKLMFFGVERFNISTGLASDSITTGDGADTLIGGGGDDVLDSGRGTASIFGGTGVDVWKADLSLLTIGITLNLTVPAVLQTLTDGSTIKGIERVDMIGTNLADRVTLGAAFAAADNRIQTLFGNDTVTIHAGVNADSSGQNIVDMGAGGDDLLIADYGAATEAVTFAYVSSQGGVEGHYTDYYNSSLNGAVMGGVGKLMFFGVERFNITTGAADDSTTTGDGADTLNGGGGDDQLDSGRGKASIAGGAGIDEWKADLSLLEQGIALNLTEPFVVQVLADGSTITEIERLDLTATNQADHVALCASFARYDNQIRTLQGDDIVSLFGGATAATTGQNIVELGAGGNDLLNVSYAAATEAVTFTLVSATGSEGLSYTDYYSSGLSGVTMGGAGKLSFTGVERFNITTGAASDIIDTGDGADTLSGGKGADQMAGGRGNDIYIVDDMGDVVTESADPVTGGIDTVRATVSATLSLFVENLVLLGGGAIDGTGNDLANSITGNDQANRLAGGGGADFLAGGLGSDTYVFTGSESLVEPASSGFDLVESSVTFTLQSNFEALTLTGNQAINGTGNVQNNLLTGNGKANVLTGGAGEDTLVGMAGNDAYLVNSTGDMVTEAALGGTDTVKTTLATYKLGANVDNLAALSTVAFTGTGNGLANAIRGKDGNDTLSGLNGNDTLTGGTGSDSFAFAAPLSAGNHDMIVDFNMGDDTIQLQNTGLQLFNTLPDGALAAAAFKVIGSGGGTLDKDDRILYKQSTGQVFYDADGADAGKAVLFAVLTGAPVLDHADFFVI